MLILCINDAQEGSFWQRKECGWDWAENTDCNHISRGMHRLLVVQGTMDRMQQHIIQKCRIVLDAATSIDNAAATSDVTGCSFLMAGVGVPTFKTRADLGNVMQSKGFTVGVELGVQNSYYTAGMLTYWPNSTEYNLVDLWGHQENSHNSANLDQETQELIYAAAMNNVKLRGGK